MPILGAYLSLKGTTASLAFFCCGIADEPKTAGAAKIAAPVVVALLIKSLREFLITISQVIIIKVLKH